MGIEIHHNFTTVLWKKQVIFHRYYLIKTRFIIPTFLEKKTPGFLYKTDCHSEEGKAQRGNLLMIMTIIVGDGEPVPREAERLPYKQTCVSWPPRQRGRETVPIPYWLVYPSVGAGHDPPAMWDDRRRENGRPRVALTEQRMDGMHRRGRVSRPAGGS